MILPSVLPLYPAGGGFAAHEGTCMILSDRDIRAELEAGRIVVDPLAPDSIQPASLDVRIDDSFRVFANHRHPYIDVRAEQSDMTELVKVTDGEPFILHPGEFVLASTY